MVALEMQSATAAHWSTARYQEVFESSVSSRVQGDRREASQTIGETPALRLALVIEEKSTVLGFLVARVLNEEWELENIVIADQVQRHGLATRLLGELGKLAGKRGVNSIFLEVRESNRAARSLYKNCGFTEMGHRKRYYRDPDEDAILYRLDLA